MKQVGRWAAVALGLCVSLAAQAQILIGQTVEDVVRFLSLEHQGVALSPVVTAVAKASLYVFPNLAAFNFDRQAAYGLAIPPMEALAALAYGAAYSAVILGLTVFFFRRRDLP